jgi:autotransporter-associated beta strand protein
VTAGGGLEFKSATTLTGGTLTLASGTFGVPPAVSVAGGATASVASAVTGTSGFVKSGLGLLVLRGTNTLSGPTTVQSGTLRLATATALPNGNVTVGADATLRVGSLLQLSLARLDLSAGGSVDVNDGLLTTASGLTPVSTVEKIREGLGDGSWNGTSGITSSAVAELVSQGTPRAIGWLDNGAGSMTVAFAAPGDTNIDGIVDILDAANFLNGGKFNSGQIASWNQGDFGYDGIVDILDAADFLSTDLYDTGPYVTFSAAGLSAVPAATLAVPEPSLVVTGVVVASGLQTCLALSRGQRRQRTAAPGRA